eukprot:GHRR01023408.1.p1 GENE.GHRR01023408.1~~GHRR01023408.1.p1  ORF type:complete len:115 (-),score=14.54 GHRR01023408.1:776-1120(-)
MPCARWVPQHDQQKQRNFKHRASMLIDTAGSSLPSPSCKHGPMHTLCYSSHLFFFPDFLFGCLLLLAAVLLLAAAALSLLPGFLCLSGCFLTYSASFSISSRPVGHATAIISCF